MSSSFTIWYKKRESVDLIPTLELHINLWIDENRNDKIDFGLKIKNPKAIDELFIYIPFLVEGSDIENLLHILSVNKSISDLVFNGNIELGSLIGEIQEVKRGDDAFHYYLLEGQVQDNLKGALLKTGRILNYSFDDSLGEKDIYLRFRINNIKNKGILERYEKNASYLTGAYNTLTSL